jgi:hypothetical protein
MRHDVRVGGNPLHYLHDADADALSSGAEDAIDRLT